MVPARPDGYCAEGGVNELSLFTGAGGGVLGTKLLGFRHVGYVEWNPYCQEVIKARIRDGYLDAAPIFGNIDNFLSEGYANAYQDMVDLLSAGFPCQPHSHCGYMQGGADDRDKWPQTAECIRVVRPKLAFLENVTGLLDSYIGRVLADLASFGFHARWGVFSAGGVGAPHLRERVWILAHAAGFDGLAHDLLEASGVRRPQEQSGGFHSLEVAAKRTATHPWFEREPGLARLVRGTPNQVDRLEAVGNAQVPAVVVRAWSELAA